MSRGTTAHSTAEPNVTAGASAPAAFIAPRAWRALAVGSIAFSLMSFNTTATNLAFDSISETFADSRASTLSWVASIFFIGMAALLPVSGRLADRIGRRRVLRTGLALFIAGSTLSALAPVAPLLIAARLVCAAGGAMVVPSSLAVILPEFPRERHMTAVAFWTASGPLASALAPAVSALILAATSWRVLFALSIPIASVALIGTYRVVQESKAATTAGRLDWLGVLLGTVVVAGLVFAVGQGPSLGWTSTAVLAAAGATVVLFPVFLRRCRRHPQPLLNLDVFLLRPVWVANLANFLLNLGSMAVWLVWPLYLGRIWGYSKLQIGLSLLPGPILSAFVTTFGGKVSERYGHEVLVRWGPSINVASLLWPLLMMTEQPNYWVSIGPAIALYIGARLGPGPRDGIMTGLAQRGPSIRSVRTGIELVALALGWLLGGTVGIGTVLFALTVGPNAQFWLERLDMGHPPGFDPKVDPEVDPDATVAVN